MEEQKQLVAKSCTAIEGLTRISAVLNRNFLRQLLGLVVPEGTVQ